MTDEEKGFKNFVRDIRFDDKPDYNHRDKLEQNLLVALDKQSRHKTQTTNMRRIIIKSQITKLATAAVIIVAVTISLIIFNNSTSSVWAIEQSIEALSKYNAVLVEGSESFLDEDGKLQVRKGKTWAVANEDQTKVEKVRIEIEGVSTIITNGRQTWRYDPQTNTVTKNLSYGTAEIWCGSRLLEQLKTFRDSGLMTKWKVTKGKDSTTGKRRIFLTCAWLDKRYNGPRSLWLEIDAESNFLVGLRQWENANWEGPARYVAEKITHYENLPDELFEFKIPKGATVIEH